MSGDGINLACVIMVSRHLSASSTTLCCERILDLLGGRRPALQAISQPGWIHISHFNSRWPHFSEIGPIVSLFFSNISAPGTILFGAAGNIQDGRRRGHLFHGGMSPLASLVLSDARTLFSSVSQSELVCLKGRLDFV